MADGSRQRGWTLWQIVPRSVVEFTSRWYHAAWMDSLADGSRHLGWIHSQMVQAGTESSNFRLLNLFHLDPLVLT